MVMRRTLDAGKTKCSFPDTIGSGGELLELRFVSGNVVRLRLSKWVGLLIQEAGIAGADDVKHRGSYSVLNETLHRIARGARRVHIIGRERYRLPDCLAAALSIGRITPDHMSRDDPDHKLLGLDGAPGG
jgi:hypothetical protein